MSRKVFTNWSKSNSNYWLYYISNLIESALKIVQSIACDARPVLIHCSDGWDRTAQIVSLAELMLDPFYRTIQGFRVLVQREWLDFGHKFADRCGVMPVSKNVNERSPIFIQWLDCVYQIVRQCPDYFEFNCTYLEELALHTYSPLFGTFSCNSYLERFINQIHGETTSVWSYLEKSRDKFINENYIESIKVLEPSYSVSDMTLWRELYQNLMTEDFESRFDMKNTAQTNLMIKNQLIDVSNQRKKKISRTNSFTNNQPQSSIESKSNYLRKFKSDSDLSIGHKRSTLKNQSDNGRITPVYRAYNSMLNNGLTSERMSDKLRNGNFQLNDQRLDPQPNCKSNYEMMTKSNCSLNGKTCKFESKTNQSFLNCDTDYQVPLKVIARIAQIANSNPDSSLMMSILTYMNSHNHTFSVK